MPELLDPIRAGLAPPPAAAAPARPVPDERPARRTLLDQVARLEAELAGLFCASWPRTGLSFGVAARGGPRLLSLGELEQLRDELDGRVREARAALAERRALEQGKRRLIEEMLREPERHRWRRVGHEDIGEPGCRHWHVRPRFGLLGMLLNWWRVRISSGCPLALER